MASPGYANQPTIRTAFRIGGLLVLAFAGLPLLAVGAWLLQAGFGGAAARYAAGELAPVVKDAGGYVTDAEKTGPFCSKCGVRDDAAARFCDACGTALA